VIATRLGNVDLAQRGRHLHAARRQSADVEIEDALIEFDPCRPVVESDDVDEAPLIEAELGTAHFDLQPRLRLCPEGFSRDDGVVEGRQRPLRLIGGAERGRALDITQPADASRRIVLGEGRTGGEQGGGDRSDKVLHHAILWARRLSALATATLVSVASAIGAVSMCRNG